MLGITDLGAYILATILIIILPGPNSLYCLSAAVGAGKRAGFLAAMGIVLGDSLLMLAAVMGVGTLLKLYPDVFVVVQWIGGAYLAYVGISLLIGVYHRLSLNNNQNDNQNDNQNQTAPIQPSLGISRQNYFMRALALSLTNPKAILFFLSFFVQFVDLTYSKPYLSFLVLALILQAVSITYLSTLVLMGQRIAHARHLYPKLALLAMGGTGLMFVGFALHLWFG